MIFVKTYNAPPFNEKEVLRYAGGKADSAAVQELFDSCKAEAVGSLFYKVCYLLFDVNVNDGYCDFGTFGVKSKDLAINLNGCDKAVIFAATLGVGIDRLIAKYGAVSPSKALMFNAIGAERIETLCDMFCEDISKETERTAKPRFSAGYGDLDLSFQNKIFSVLNCQKHIGLTITDSLIMSPSKSVTAVVGLSKTRCEKPSFKCDNCRDNECSLRGDL